MLSVKDSFDGSELRQDPITEKWVVVATGRGKRPRKEENKEKKEPEKYAADCAFCNFDKFPQAKESLFLPNENDWRVKAFPNKFPAFTPKDTIGEREEGIFRVREGVGFHEVITMKEHNSYPSSATDLDLMLYLKAMRERYLEFSKKPTVNYIQIIENHGRDGGASMEHVHAQIFAIPIVPTDEVLDLLVGAEKYFRKNKRCGYCDIIDYERNKGTRVIYENDLFVVLSPFTPRVGYEQWILPKEHHPGFERLTDLELPYLVQAMQVATRGIKKVLDDPAYNMYLYSSPCDDIGSFYPRDQYSNFHWQIHILPRQSVWAGFELATGVEITSVLPEESAKALREAVNK